MVKINIYNIYKIYKKFKSIFFNLSSPNSFDSISPPLDTDTRQLISITLKPITLFRSVDTYVSLSSCPLIQELPGTGYKWFRSVPGHFRGPTLFHFRPSLPSHSSLPLPSPPAGAFFLRRSLSSAPTRPSGRGRLSIHPTVAVYVRERASHPHRHASMSRASLLWREIKF